jgi:hypothetical protein
LTTIEAAMSDEKFIFHLTLLENQFFVSLNYYLKYCPPLSRPSLSSHAEAKKNQKNMLPFSLSLSFPILLKFNLIFMTGF